MANNWALSRGRTDRREAGLGWRDQLVVLRRVFPLLWPKGEAELKFRVAAALALIFLGKLVNVALPPNFSFAHCQYSDASMIVRTRVVTSGLAGSGEPYSCRRS